MTFDPEPCVEPSPKSHSKVGVPVHPAGCAVALKATGLPVVPVVATVEERT